tara:strand:+ start:55 stop:396 length:342 start_codon:yes stop_codon:yes gene_type:complete
MGLKDDIFTALITNIQPDNPGENFDLSDKAIDKVDTLAQDLTNAIVNFIQAQTFTITKLNATQLNVPVITPTGPGTAAKVTVKVDENSQAVDNPLSGAESMTSEVKLNRAIEV